MGQKEPVPIRPDVEALLKENHVIFDVKCTLNREIVDGRL